IGDARWIGVTSRRQRNRVCPWSKPGGEGSRNWDCQRRSGSGPPRRTIPGDKLLAERRSRKQRERQRPCGRRGGHGAGVGQSEVRKTGDAMARPSWESSLLGAADAKFSAEKRRRQKIRRSRP